MNKLFVYRILSFILIPIACIIACIDLLIVLVSLANPAFLMIAFAMACFVIYVATSTRFLLYCIDKGNTCSKSLKDWIKVNAYVTIAITALFLLNSLAIFFIREVDLTKAVTDVLEQQPELTGKVSIDMMLKMVKVMAFVMLFLSSVTLTHISLQFKIWKKYNHLFEA